MYFYDFSGNIDLSWYVKVKDDYTPMYNDSGLYRKDYAYNINLQNNREHYNIGDNRPRFNSSLDEITHPSRYGIREVKINVYDTLALLAFEECLLNVVFCTVNLYFNIAKIKLT